MIDKQTNTRLKRFAQEARRYLIDQVNTKLSEVLAPDSDAATYEKTKPLYNGLLLEVKKVTGSESLPSEIDKLKPLAERVAYTWFNRLTALRYMDLKHFNPMGIVSPQAGDSLPQILSEAKMGIIDASLINPEDMQRVLGLLSGTVECTYHKGDAQSEAYRILLLGACNSIGKSLPFLFKPIKDWMELLLPDDLLGEHGILAMIREAMTEESCQDVEVIGWLYQFYISEKKDEVFAQVKKGKKVQSNEIPAVTQLFTPHWIVKYMVQNSLGRLWLDSHPKSSLNDKMEYFVAQDSDPAEPYLSQDGHLALRSPEEINFCDPCCGSGHILTYAFDLLYEIYSEEGYDPIDIPRLIISKNLYGIEIDERASELAAFALSMKARDKDRQWFSRGIDPQICCLENIRFGKDELEPYLDRCGRDLFTYNFERMLSQFEHADTFGSLIVPHEQDIEGIRELLNAKDFSGDVFLAPTHNKVLKLIEQADYLRTKYQVVVTNPPYLGTSGMGKEKEDWFKSYYPNSRSDFFAMFMERCLSISVKQGFIAMINMQSWMFLSSYEKLRKHLVKHYELITMAHLGPRAFDSIGGEVVSTTSFIIQNSNPDNKHGAYFRLIEGKSEEEKSQLFLDALTNLQCGRVFYSKTTYFSKIPGAPFAYWASPKVYEAFSSLPEISSWAECRKGMFTGDNALFLRFWWELGTSSKDVKLYSKGGEYRRWYGNIDLCILWTDNGRIVREHVGSGNIVDSMFFREAVTWSLVCASDFNARYLPPLCITGDAGPVCFPHKENIFLVLAFFNSVVANYFAKLLNPTMNFSNGVIGKLPLSNSITTVDSQSIDVLVQSSKQDWDSYENSWEFLQLPLLQVSDIKSQASVKQAYDKLREQWIDNTLTVQELEEENNRIFIEVYGLKNELSPEVPLRYVTLTCNPYYRYGIESSQLTIAKEFPLRKDIEERLLSDTIKELISYAVGCMFGRYSLDKPGLILANLGETLDDYLSQVCQPSFLPDKDNVIPILEGEWFVDDIVSRFSQFLKVAFGADKYSENISFIEEAIGKDLRTYFLKDFENDHVKRYKKRPIYWLFSSPKGSFNALIYIHRYTPDTVLILLNGYLREYIHKIRAKSQQLEHQLGSGALSEREKMLTRKEIDRLKDVISELEAWEAKVILPLAEKRIEIDLDDGVKVNYLKFSGAVRNIPGLAAKEE